MFRVSFSLHAVVCAGEYVFREGDLTSALRICHKGKVAILGQDGIIQDVLKAGSYFGMESLLSPGPCTTSAVVLSNCDIMTLKLDLISDSMQLCPTSSAAVRRNFAALYVPESCSRPPGQHGTNIVALCSSCHAQLRQLVLERSWNAHASRSYMLSYVADGQVDALPCWVA
jgi:hypothetical protein